MRKTIQPSTGILLSTIVFGFVFTGCNQAETDSSKTPANNESTDVSKKEHDHSGWWCGEHGVPEDVCTRCNSTLIADFKVKNDWCEEHSRPESQCFICNPDLEAKFAARYEAKFGKKPPEITDP